MASSTNGAPPGASSARPSFTRPSFTQVTASALAAVSAAVISSTFGVAGTLIGAAIASVIASVGSTLYLASLRSTNDRFRRLAAARRPDAAAAPEIRESEERLAAQRQTSWWSRWRWSRLRDGLPSLRRRWLAVGVLTIAVFGLAVGALTAVEASTNQPVSALLGGGSGSGTSLGQVLDQRPKATTKPIGPTVTPTPRPSSTPAPGTEQSPAGHPSGQPTPAVTSTAGTTAHPSQSANAGDPAPSPSAIGSIGSTGTPTPASSPRLTPPATAP